MQRICPTRNEMQRICPTEKFLSKYVHVLEIRTDILSNVNEVPFVDRDTVDQAVKSRNGKAFSNYFARWSSQHLPPEFQARSRLAESMWKANPKDRQALLEKQDLAPMEQQVLSEMNKRLENSEQQGSLSIDGIARVPLCQVLKQHPPEKGPLKLDQAYEEWHQAVIQAQPMVVVTRYAPFATMHWGNKREPMLGLDGRPDFRADQTVAFYSVWTQHGSGGGKSDRTFRGFVEPHDLKQLLRNISDKANGESFRAKSQSMGERSMEIQLPTSSSSGANKNTDAPFEREGNPYSLDIDSDDDDGGTAPAFAQQRSDGNDDGGIRRTTGSAACGTQPNHSGSFSIDSGDDSRSVSSDASFGSAGYTTFSAFRKLSNSNNNPSAMLLDPVREEEHQHKLLAMEREAVRGVTAPCMVRECHKYAVVTSSSGNDEEEESLDIRVNPMVVKVSLQKPGAATAATNEPIASNMLGRLIYAQDDDYSNDDSSSRGASNGGESPQSQQQQQQQQPPMERRWTAWINDVVRALHNMSLAGGEGNMEPARHGILNALLAIDNPMAQGLQHDTSLKASTSETPSCIMSALVKNPNMAALVKRFPLPELKIMLAASDALESSGRIAATLDASSSSHDFKPIKKFMGLIKASPNSLPMVGRWNRDETFEAAVRGGVDAACVVVDALARNINSDSNKAAVFPLPEVLTLGTRPLTVIIWGRKKNSTSNSASGFAQQQRVPDLGSIGDVDASDNDDDDDDDNSTSHTPAATSDEDSNKDNDEDNSGDDGLRSAGCRRTYGSPNDKIAAAENKYSLLLVDASGARRVIHPNAHQPPTQTQTEDMVRALKRALNARARRLVASHEIKRLKRSFAPGAALAEHESEEAAKASREEEKNAMDDLDSIAPAFLPWFVSEAASSEKWSIVSGKHCASVVDMEGGAVCVAEKDKPVNLMPHGAVSVRTCVLPSHASVASVLLSKDNDMAVMMNTLTAAPRSLHDDDREKNKPWMITTTTAKERKCRDPSYVSALKELAFSQTLPEVSVVAPGGGGGAAFDASNDGHRSMLLLKHGGATRNNWPEVESALFDLYVLVHAAYNNSPSSEASLMQAAALRVEGLTGTPLPRTLTISTLVKHREQLAIEWGIACDDANVQAPDTLKVVRDEKEAAAMSKSATRAWKWGQPFAQQSKVSWTPDTFRPVNVVKRTRLAQNPSARDISQWIDDDLRGACPLNENVFAWAIETGQLPRGTSQSMLVFHDDALTHETLRCAKKCDLTVGVPSTGDDATCPSLVRRVSAQTPRWIVPQDTPHEVFEQIVNNFRIVPESQQPNAMVLPADVRAFFHKKGDVSSHGDDLDEHESIVPTTAAFAKRNASKSIEAFQMRSSLFRVEWLLANAVHAGDAMHGGGGGGNGNGNTRSSDEAGPLDVTTKVAHHDNETDLGKDPFVDSLLLAHAHWLKHDGADTDATIKQKQQQQKQQRRKTVQWTSDPASQTFEFRAGSHEVADSLVESIVDDDSSDSDDDSDESSSSSFTDATMSDLMSDALTDTTSDVTDTDDTESDARSEDSG